jgi:hypothetical protein
MYFCPVTRLGLPNLRSIGACVSIAVGASLGILAPTAVAAAPPNDHFESRTLLTEPLPIHLSESNEGATKEATEEPRIGSLASSGHSIWWEWEAPATEWITVSTCESDFPTVVNIFEGSELGHLTSLTDEQTNGDEGPQCWASGTAYTFAATVGQKYVIGADGNGFYPPPLPPEEPHIPRGEGTIQLSVEATPPPPNDDFADATPIGNALRETRESPFEEPNEDRYLWEEFSGYNWGATKQEGEPDHAGDPGGASVWYAWAPTESGEAQISLQGAGGPKLLAMYSGSTLSGLVPVASSASASAGSIASLSAAVTGGTEYRIAVDGSQTEGSLEPWRGSFMGSFEVAVNLILPPLPALLPAAPPAAKIEAPAPAPALVPVIAPSVPDVKLASHKVDPVAGTATFSFVSRTKGAKFECKVDGQGFKACSSPFKVKGLKPGKHLFEVVARAGSKVDSTPAVVHFTLAAPHRHRHSAG